MPAMSNPFILTLFTWWLAQTAPTNPHYDSTHGVDRVPTLPPTVGECTQCHSLHENEGLPPEPKTLFAPNDNQLCFNAGGPNGCHAALPSGYPAQDTDRLPEGTSAPGYFEANSGGTRLPGVLLRRRWTGALIYEDPRASASGHYLSPHRNDPDMPLQDSDGHGLCLNCHNPHEGASDHDLLNKVYQPWGGSYGQQASVRLAACLDCHGPSGPFGMEDENRRIADYYNRAINSDHGAGHQIRKNGDIALYWPPWIRGGDPLPCFECHNPHGSRGADGVTPNAFAISDQRSGWRGLTDTRTDPAQSRRFCLGCHIPADGVPGSISVGGILMNTLPDEDPHMTSATKGCFECHGSDYSTSTSFNVHHPSEGDD